MKKKQVIGIIEIFILLILLSLLMARLIHSKNCLDKKEEVIRVGTYNMMFGMYGRIAITNGLAYFAFHGIHSQKLTEMLSIFNKATAKMIGEQNIDIVNINEVLGTLRKDILIEELKNKAIIIFAGELLAIMTLH